MALIFRAAFLGKGVRFCVSNANSGKFTIKSSLFSTKNCSCKVLVSYSAPFRRDYSTQKSREEKSEDFDDDEKLILPKPSVDGREVIYSGLLARNVRNIKFFSLSTTFLALSCQPYIYSRAMATGALNDYTLPMLGVVGIFAIGTPILLHYVTKRYILDVEYDPKTDKYFAHIYNIFVKKKEIEFTPADVTIPTVLGMFTTCAIKGKKVFLDAESFTDQAHYVKIMGYDKPLDLQVKLADVKESDPSKKD